MLLLCVTLNIMTLLLDVVVVCHFEHNDSTVRCCCCVSL